MTGLLFGAGLDYTYAGAKTLYFGDYQNPYGEQLLQKVGVPAGTSGWLYDAMMLGGIGLAATQIAKLGPEAAYLVGKETAGAVHVGSDGIKLPSNPGSQSSSGVTKPNGTAQTGSDGVKLPSNPGSQSSSGVTKPNGTAHAGNNFNVNELVNSANKPVNAQGLSEAARAWEKHAGRQGGTFEPLKGNTAQKNEAASKFVKDVLENPNTVRTELSRGGVEYRLPSGQGIRYNADGSFSTVLDPKR